MAGVPPATSVVPLGGSRVSGSGGSSHKQHRRLAMRQHPRGDRAHHQPAQRAMAAAITGAQCVPVPHSGHLPHLERPEEFDTLLLDFLRHAKAWLH